MKGNLLIVDDEEHIVDGIQYLVSEYADKIFTAFNGLEALEVLKKEEVHCIICDINMPKMNGLEVIKKVRENQNDVPFIFYTAHGNQELMIEVVKYGAFDFLSKPNLDGLIDVVKRGLNEGIKKVEDRQVDENAYISEYQKLLQEMEENKKNNKT